MGYKKAKKQLSMKMKLYTKAWRRKSKIKVRKWGWRLWTITEGLLTVHSRCKTASGQTAAKHVLTKELTDLSFEATHIRPNRTMTQPHVYAQRLAYFKCEIKALNSSENGKLFQSLQCFMWEFNNIHTHDLRLKLNYSVFKASVTPPRKQRGNHFQPPYR